MDTQTFGSGFTKREFVVTVGDDRYPQDIKMEFVKDKTAVLDKFRPGARVKVGFDLRGGEHNGRYYVNLQAWRMHPADGSEPPSDGGENRSGGESRGGYSAPPRQAPPRQSDRGSDDRGRGGDRGGRWDRDDDRRPRRQDDFRSNRRGNAEDDIDF